MIDKRLGKLEVVYRRREAARPAPAPSGFDASRLTTCQQFELDVLLERVEYCPDAPTRFAEWDGLAVLCVCRLQRLRDLTATAYGLPPVPSSRSGPCRDCIAAEIEEEVAPCRRALGEGATA